jgi:exopolyphosphatase/guanosine-5'-triphosphate,3'-diphosphate pyrophosphatase
MRKAAIDIGTNSTRLMIAEVKDGKIGNVLTKKAIITRLGKGVSASGNLGCEGIERTLKVIKQYCIEANQFGVENVAAVATSATREAENGRDFVNQVERIIGAPVKIISGKQEAKLTFKGAIQGREISKSSLLLVIDIGGGSEEVVIGAGDKIYQQESLDIGCVRLTEMFINNDPPSQEEINNLRNYVFRQLTEKFSNRYSDKIKIAIGVAGTPTTLASISLGLRTYDRQLVEGYELKQGKIKQLLKKLSCLDIKERQKVVGLQPERADVIISGTAILLETIRFFGLGSVLVSEHDILDGLMVNELESIQDIQEAEQNI